MAKVDLNKSYKWVKLSLGSNMMSDYFIYFIRFYLSFSVMPPSRFDVAASGGVGPCFGEPPLPALPLQGGDDELFSPQSNNGDMSPSCCADNSPTFDKPIFREMEKTIDGARFVAQHVRNKDKFESVSISIHLITTRFVNKKLLSSFYLLLVKY